MMAQMRVDIYGDLSCPWCHLGWRRLRAAFSLRPELQPELHWKPFQLNPDIPPAGLDRQDYLLRKFGNSERIREVLHAVDLAMRADGVHVNLHRIKTMPNTYLAHRLMLAAESCGLTDALLNALFVAFFVQGQDIGDKQILVDISREVGLSGESVHAILQETEPSPEIAQSEAEARQMNVRAVPYFMFDGKYTIAGAHDPIAFLPLMDLCMDALFTDGRAATE